jgi:TonB family protein
MKPFVHRPFPKFPLILIFAVVVLSLSPLLAQTGTIERVGRKGLAQVKWDLPGASPGRLGLLMEVDLAVGVFRVLESTEMEGTIECLDCSAAGVFAAGRRLWLQDVPRPVSGPDQGTLLVWSPEVGAPLQVDGKEAGATPAYAVLDPGLHEVSIRLRKGGGAGARIEAAKGTDDTLYLCGLQREAGPQWNPRYLLEGKIPEKSPKKPGKVRAGARVRLQWIDEAGGARIYLGLDPVKHPVILHRVEPVYPEAAKKTHLGGRVAVEAIVGEDGQVHGARVVASHDGDLSRAALSAVEQWTYSPGTLEGKPIPVLLNVFVDFYMTGG